MKSSERAAQIWPVLALAAINRQVLTYDQVGGLIGVPRVGLGQLLDPIHAYCTQHELPPLTVLVVGKETGMPGSGFTAASDIPSAQAEVFNFPWLEHSCPTPESLEQAITVGSSI